MKPRYIIRGIQTSMQSWLQTLLWYMRDSIEVPERDYLEIFRLRYDFQQHVKEKMKYSVK